MRKYTFILVALLFNTIFSQEKQIVVLELFTSQGCSSCPSADVVLAEIKNDFSSDVVIPISYHVDYWNYIGWKDPFSLKKYTRKQRAYGQKFRGRSIYTPQIVINGKEHLVGSNGFKIYQKIKHYTKENTTINQITISDIVSKNNSVNFDYSIKGDFSGKEIRFLLLIDERITNVKRGENSNRTLTNSNIVVNEITESILKKEGNKKITIPKIVTQKDALKLIVLIQDTNLNITGGKQITL